MGVNLRGKIVAGRFRALSPIVVVILVELLPGCLLPGHVPAEKSSSRAICNHGTYRHIPGDFPEYGPPQTLYVGTTPDGIGSVYRVEAPAPSVTEFYVNGGGQLNYVFQLQGDLIDPARLLWREDSDANCRGTLTVKTDPANSAFTLYAAEPSDAAFAMKGG
ncbi:MAG TPA: hypothetical protein VGV88_12770 [Candidatus Dormibacteraeota bacterium]|nr:hypothetical protein [Candidatus Dormibacteraeota bacterium]